MHMKYRVFSYSFKVWLTSALITPVVVTPFMLLRGRVLFWSAEAPKIPLSVLLESYIIVAGILLLSSLLPWIINLMLLRRLVKSSFSKIAVRCILLAIVSTLPGVILYIGQLKSDFAQWQTVVLGWIAFLISTYLCLWVFKLKPVRT